jgi:hypothetical protein
MGLSERLGRDPHSPRSHKVRESRQTGVRSLQSSLSGLGLTPLHSGSVNGGASHATGGAVSGWSGYFQRLSEGSFQDETLLCALETLPPSDVALWSRFTRGVSIIKFPCPRWPLPVLKDVGGDENDELARRALLVAVPEETTDEWEAS